MVESFVGPLLYGHVPEANDVAMLAILIATIIAKLIVFVNCPPQVDATKMGGLARFINHCCDVCDWECFASSIIRLACEALLLKSA